MVAETSVFEKTSLFITAVVIEVLFLFFDSSSRADGDTSAARTAIFC
jgi:hypothetical protein